jgi:arginase
MKFVAVKSSQGALGKNNGTELAPEVLLKEFNDIFEAPIKIDNLIETNKVLEKVKGDFFVGGDHSITYGLVRGMAKKYKKFGFVMFDAHPDCVNNFSPPTHEDFIRVLIEEKVLKPENILLIGLRNMDDIEKQFLNAKKIKYLRMEDLKKNNTSEMIKDFVKNMDGWYLSMDIDVLDILYAPGTGYPEKRGMRLSELIHTLSEIKNMKNLKRIDLVEVNPLKDKKNRTIMSAKKIIDEFVQG